MPTPEPPRDPEAQLAELRQQLLRYRADRHPVEHATLQFHVGTTLLQSDRSDQAATALRTARDLFAAHDRHVEHAKSLNMLGVALREIGETAEGAEAFARAADLFAEHGHRLEEGAASFNLGLLHVAHGDHDRALDRFEQAWELLSDGPPAQAAAVARELGSLHLTLGDPDAAVAILEPAIELASRAGDRAGMGAAANTLGLAHLAAGRSEAAVVELRTAVASHPRRVRPDAYAMARANLALAYERTGDGPRARLAARQAAGTPGAPAPVVQQADEIVGRLGSADDDLMVVLDRTDDEEARTGELRHEASRWLDAEEDERLAACGAWIDGQVAREGRSTELAAAYLGVLLELPRDGFEALVRSTIRAVRERPDDAADRFRTDAERAMARFNVPQFMRLKDTFARIADEEGDGGDWA